MPEEIRREDIAHLLRTHAEIIRKTKIPVLPVDTKTVKAEVKTQGDLTGLLQPNPSEVAKALATLADRIRKVPIYRLDEPTSKDSHEERIRKQYIIELHPDFPQARASYYNGRIVHGKDIESPFSAYEDGSIHIITGNGYIKGEIKEGGKIEYKARPVPEYSGIEPKEPVVFIRINGKTYVINPHRVLTVHPQTKIE